jgi:alanine racemase
MKVFSPTVKTRFIKRGDSALYGNVKCRGGQISLVRYGYADGLNRKQIKGQINNRCMDVSAILGKQNSWACIMDNADVLAKEYGTISYEILTKCALKAQKIYIN